MKHQNIKQELYNIHLITIHLKHKDVPLETLQNIDRMLMDRDIKIRELENVSMSKQIQQSKDLLDTLENVYNNFEDYKQYI